MKTISIVKEKLKDERRVIITPKQVQELTLLGFEVFIEHDAGAGCNFLDSDYENSGDKVVDRITSWITAK